MRPIDKLVRLRGMIGRYHVSVVGEGEDYFASLAESGLTLKFSHLRILA